MKNSKIGLVAMVLVLMAITREVRKPAEERTWHGSLFGFIPYDFRRPNMDRVLASYWNPDSDQLLTPQVFGVGWAVNFYRLKEMVEA
jgi:hypothetical protein